jgi:hypothetical protein
MKEQLIAYETAILAKEKNLPQDDFYFEDYDCRIPYYGLDNVLGKGDEDKFGQCKAISQNLLQKWLREVHNIHVCVYWDYSYSNERDLYYTEIRYKDDLGFRVDKFVKDNNFRNYEEALEIGLQEGLKLIK